MAEATYGGFWIRTLAYFADISIIVLAVLLLAIPFHFMGGAGVAVFGLLAAFGPLAYFVWLSASDRQATFGKQLCGLKIQHAGSGEGVSLLRSLGRELAKFVSSALLFIGFLMAAFTGRKQGLHDMLASTVVVREGEPRIMLAILVALAGVIVPAIVIPLMFGAMFAGLVMGMMGGMPGGTELKQTKPIPQMEKKAAPLPQAPAAKQAAAAVDDPAAVYRHFHQAMIDSDIDGMRKWGTKAKGDEFTTMPAVERKVMLGLMASMTPKTYQVKSSEASADGNKATLYLSAEQTDKGKTETVLATVTLLKEGGAWKVDLSSWGGEQPSGPAPQNAAAKPAAAEPPRPVEPAAPVARRTSPEPAAQPRSAPTRSEAAPAKPAAAILEQSKPPCVYKPVMSDEDIARCR